MKVKAMEIQKLRKIKRILNILIGIAIIAGAIISFYIVYNSN